MDGFAKLLYLYERLGEVQMKLMCGIRQVFDPKGSCCPWFAIYPYSVRITKPGRKTL